jgi:ATP-dependent Lhr-like helicase
LRSTLQGIHLLRHCPPRALDMTASFGERLSALVKGPLQRIGLSATQKPIEEVARFLVGGCGPGSADGSSACLLKTAAPLPLETKPDEPSIGSGGRAVRAPVESLPPPCTIVDIGHSQQMDLAIELPGSPLEAVMSTEVWAEVYNRLADLIEAHRTTLVFVNTRRLVERVSHQLSERLGDDKVGAHHGSLSRKTRLSVEEKLKSGALPVVVATASLELGIDIGHVDVVCQIGSVRSLGVLLQRVGRSGHWLGATPKGIFYPLTRDDLVECAAGIRAIRAGELDRLSIVEKPLDILAQQMVAIVASAAVSKKDEGESGGIAEEALWRLVRRAYPYRDLTRDEVSRVAKQAVAPKSSARREQSWTRRFSDTAHGFRSRRFESRHTSIGSVVGA